MIKKETNNYKWVENKNKTYRSVGNKFKSWIKSMSLCKDYKSLKSVGWWIWKEKLERVYQFFQNIK